MSSLTGDFGEVLELFADVLRRFVAQGGALADAEPAEQAEQAEQAEGRDDR